MNLIGSFKPFKSLKMMFESRRMDLTNLATFGVAVGDTLLAVEFEVENRY
jgi:hypothetical protein